MVTSVPAPELVWVSQIQATAPNVWSVFWPVLVGGRRGGRAFLVSHPSVTAIPEAHSIQGNGGLLTCMEQWEVNLVP